MRGFELSSNYTKTWQNFTRKATTFSICPAARAVAVKPAGYRPVPFIPQKPRAKAITFNAQPQQYASPLSWCFCRVLYLLSEARELVAIVGVDKPQHCFRLLRPVSSPGGKSLALPGLCRDWMEIPSNHRWRKTALANRRNSDNCTPQFGIIELRPNIKPSVKIWNVPNKPDLLLPRWMVVNG